MRQLASHPLTWTPLEGAREYPIAWAQERDPATERILKGLVVAYAALLPYQIELAVEFRFAPSDFCAIAACLLAFPALRFRQACWSGWHLALALAFVTASFTAAFQTGALSRYALVNKNIGFLLLLLSYAEITSAVENWDELRRILRAFVLSVVAQNIVAVVAFGVSYSAGADSLWTSYGGQRLCGLMVDANAYGGLLVMTLALIEGSAGSAAALLSGWRLALARLSLAGGILLTFSRTSWLALAVVLVCLWILRPRTIAPTMLMGLAALSGILLAPEGGLLSFVSGMANRPELVRGRFELMRSAWDQFQHHPILGGGLNSFRELEGTIVHNTPLWFLSDFGLLGLAAFAGFAAWLFFKGRRAVKTGPPAAKSLVIGLMLGHVAMLSVALGIEAFYQRHWWMVMALLAASHSLASQSKESYRDDVRI